LLETELVLSDMRKPSYISQLWSRVFKEHDIEHIDIRAIGRDAKLDWKDILIILLVIIVIILFLEGLTWIDIIPNVPRPWP